MPLAFLVTDITPSNAKRYITHVATSGWAIIVAATTATKKFISKLFGL